ncbi:uncharacterized protein LOC144434145 [Glandiceps talaboti]
MMVAVEGSFDSALSPLLETLEDGTSVVDDRVDAYLTLTDRLRDDEKEAFSREICKKTGTLVNVYQRDMMDDSTELSQACLQALGFCLHHPDISKAILSKDATSILKGLCNTLLKTSDKSTCTRSLWCIAKQNFPEDIVRSEIHSILCAVEHVLLKGGYQSMAVEHEAINVILRLLDQLPDSMEVHAMRWGNLVYPMLLHSAHKIRDRAVQAMKLGFQALVSHRHEIVKTLVPDLKGLFIQEMTKLFESRQEIYVLQIWQFFVDLLGKGLHKGGSLINSILNIVERGFKSSIPEVRCAAYQSWKHLIDNFALDLDILCNHKRLKLLLQPFKNTAAKQEQIALAKLDAWWHLVKALDIKLINNFDQVCVPLLQYSLGLSSMISLQCPSTPVTNGPVSRLSTPNIHRSGSVLGSPATPHINLPGSTNNICVSKFKSVQSKGIEILAHFLAKTDSVAIEPGLDFTIDPLKHSLVSSTTTFTKVAPILIHCVRDVFCNHGTELKESQVWYIWQCLSAHMTTLLELGPKKDTIEIFTLYLSSLQSIINSEKFTPSFTLKLMEVVSKVPQKVLSSPAYHVGNAEVMHGTPALYLIQLLFHHSLLETVNIERYFCVLELFVDCGLNNPTSVLRFTQSILEMLDKAAVAIDNKENMWRIWSIVVNVLLQHVIQSNEVNQGDSLDHDFSAMYLALTLPVHRIFTYNISQGTLKSLLKTWSELYHTFARCAALVATAEANLCCEDLCVRILSVTDEDTLMDMKVVDALLHLCQAMVDCIDFSPFSNQHSPNTKCKYVSPAKPSRKKYRPLGNLTLLTQLLCKLLSSLHQFSNSGTTSFTGVLTQTSTSTSTTSQSWSTAVTCMISVLSTLFSHITMASMLFNMLQKLSQPMASLFEAAAKPQSMGGMFTSVLNHKLDKLWNDLLTAVESRYKKHYDSEFLAVLAPLLQATFLSPRRSFKNRTLLFWNATFGNAESLDYPNTFKPCLRKLKEKTPINLPNFDDSEVHTIEETPYSLGMDSEASQVMGPPPVPIASIIPTFGQPSPKRMHGSFLKKTSGETASPIRAAVSSPISGSKNKQSFLSPNSATARRKLPLAIDEDRKLEFVRITPSPKKKRVLTEHQKEVLRSRRVVPAMYNDLDASQDTNLMAELLASQSLQGTQEEFNEETEISSKKNSKDDTDTTVVMATTIPSTKDNEKITPESDVAVMENVPKESRKDKKCVSFSGLIKESERNDTENDVCLGVNGERQEDAKDKDGRNDNKDDDAVSKMIEDSIELFSDVRDPDDDIQKRQSELSWTDINIAKETKSASLIEDIDLEHNDGDKTDEDALDDEKDDTDVQLPWKQEDGELKIKEQSSRQLGCQQMENDEEEMEISEGDKLGTDNREESVRDDALSGLDTTSEDIVVGTPPKEPPTKSKHRRVSLITLSGKSTNKKNQPFGTDTAVQSISPRKDDGSKSDEVAIVPDRVAMVPETQTQELSQESQPLIKTEPIDTIVTIADSQNESSVQAGTSLSIDRDSDVMILSQHSQTLLATPVLKLKRLTEEDIKKYSPKKSAAVQTKSTTSPKTKQTKSTSSPRTKTSKKNSPKSEKRDLVPESQTSPRNRKKSKRRRSIIQQSLLENTVQHDSSVVEIEGVTPFPVDKDDDDNSFIQESAKSTPDGEDNIASIVQDSQTGGETESQDYTADVSSQELSPTKTKTRERKKPKSFRTEKDGLFVDSEVSTSQDVSEVNPPPKRKRGRPKKNPPKPSLLIVDDVTTLSSKDGPCHSQGPKSKKRPKRYSRSSEVKVESAQDREDIKESEVKGGSSQDGQDMQRPEAEMESSEDKENQRLNIEEESSQDCMASQRSKVAGDSLQACTVIQDKEIQESEDTDIHDMSQESVDLFASQKDSEQQIEKLDNEKLDKEMEMEIEVQESKELSVTNPQTCEMDSENSNKGKTVCPDDSEDMDKLSPRQEDDGMEGVEVAGNPDDVASDSDKEISFKSDVNIEELDKEAKVKENDICNNENQNSVTNSPHEISTGPKRRGRKKRLVGKKKEKSPNQAAAKKVLQRVVKSPSRSPRVTRSQKVEFVSPVTRRRASVAKRLKSSENKQESKSQLKKASKIEESSAVMKKEMEKCEEDSKMDEEEDDDDDDDWNVPLVNIVSKHVMSDKKDTVETGDGKIESLEEGKEEREKETETDKESETVEDSSTVVTDNKSKTQTDNSSVAEDKESKTTINENSVVIDKETETLVDDGSVVPEKESLTVADSSTVLEGKDTNTRVEDSSVVADSKCKTVAGGSSIKGKSDNSERIESSQSPPKQTTKSSTTTTTTSASLIKDSPLSSPQNSPVASRRFIFPKLSTLSSPSRREKKTTQGSPSRLMNLSPAQMKLADEMYSPKTSPGGGILKRKCTDSPSPPNKMRRVSFAEPLEQDEDESSAGQKGVNRCLELNKSSLPPSPLVTTTPSKVMTSQSKFMTTPSRTNDSSCKVSPGNARSYITPTSSNIRKRRITKIVDSQSQGSQEEEFETQDIVYPDLNQCQSPVENVLPQLTSVVWSRGLGQLVRARNIHTVGNLCSLTCGEVQNLPIRSPKVQTIRKAMSKFQMQLKRSGKTTNKSAPQPLPGNSSQECNNKTTDKDATKEKYVAELLEDSSQLLDEISKLSQTVSSETRETTETIQRSNNLSEQTSNKTVGSSQGHLSTKNTPSTEYNDKVTRVEACKQNDLTSVTSSPVNELDIAECPVPCKKPRIAERLAGLVDDFTEDNLTELSSEEIFQAHQNVSLLMNSIVGALKQKCK